MLKIGLTGGIGSGKTAVSKLFSKLGVDIIDMDVLAREVVMPGQAALLEIKNCFGEQICMPNGELDRKKLREIIFADPGKRQQLEAIVHPRIRERTQARLAELNAAYCIIVIPLLFETGRQDTVDRVLLVDTRVETQIQRTMARDNISEADVKNIIATQVDRQSKLKQADDIINNTGDIKALQSQVKRLHQFYLELSRKQASNT